MLTEAIKKNITSLSLSELESLREEFLQQDGDYTEKKFITYLYKRKKITATEYKNIQTGEKIDLTPVSNISDISDLSAGDAQSAHNKKFTGTYIDSEDYTVLESIDEGAMGEIFIARDNKLNRTVAYKKIHQHVAEIPSYLGRFYMEAQVTAQLQHPNIVPVYGLISSAGAVGYAMKLIDGITLKDHIRAAQDQYAEFGEPDQHHTLHARLEHFLKVCDAIHYAHRKGVIHRDLKPLNIMIGSYNEVYVMDWGITKTVDVDNKTFVDKTLSIGHETVDEEDKTKMGQVMGTPAYMSPEQAEGEHDILDHRSDLYSLGLILFELVTLNRAIDGKNTSEVMLKARRGKIDKPPPYKKQIYEQSQLLAIVEKATQYMPEDRYPTVAEFADDIRRFIHGEAIKARPESIKQKIIRWAIHHRTATVNITIGFILASFVSVAMSLFLQLQTLQQAQTEDARINHFIAEVAEKTQFIDAKFLHYETILENLSTGATEILHRGSPDESPYHTSKTIADPKFGPSDYRFSEFYGFPVSIDYPVYKLAPGVSEIDARPVLQRLGPLRRLFKSLILESHEDDLVPDTEQARRVMMDQGLPIVWSYIGLEAGMIAAYPGNAGYPDAYDPRQRSWYRATVGQTGIRWQRPYIDVSGRRLLPVTNPLYNDNGAFIGAAAVELALEYIRKRLLPLSGVDGLEEIYLLNEKGEIIITASETSQADESGLFSTGEPEVFPNQYVVNKIGRKQTGHYFYFDKDREKAIVYYRLDSTGWYYVAISDVDSAAD